LTPNPHLGTNPTTPTPPPTEPTSPTVTEPTPPPTTEPTSPTVTEPTPPPTTEPTPPPTTEPIQPTEPKPSVPQIEILGRNEDGVPVVTGVRGSSNGFFWSNDGQTVFGIHRGYIEMLESHEASAQFTLGDQNITVDFRWCEYDGEIGVMTNEHHAYELTPIIGNTQYVMLDISGDSTYLLDLETLEISDPFCDVRSQLSNEISVLSFSSDLKWAIFDSNNIDYILNVASGEYASIEEFTGITGATGGSFVSNTEISVFVVTMEEEDSFFADAWVYSLEDGSSRPLYEDLLYGWLIDIGGVDSAGQMHIHNHSGGSGVCVIDCATGTHHFTGLPDVLDWGNCGYGKVFIQTWNRDGTYLVSQTGIVVHVFTTKIPEGELLPYDPSMEDWQYDLLPDVWYSLIYSEDEYKAEVESYGLNASDFKEGRLYLINKENLEVILICDEPVRMYKCDYRYVYYTTEHEPNVIVRSSLDGTQKDVVYTSDGELTYFDTAGGSPFMLGILEDAYIVKQLNLHTSQITIVYEHDQKNLYHLLMFGSDPLSPYFEAAEINGRIFTYHSDTGEIQIIG